MCSSSFLLLCLLCLRVDSARILAVFPHSGKSHFDVFEPLVVALADRGHDVTVISYFPQKVRINNYRDIGLQEVSPLYVNALPFEAVASSNPMSDFIKITTKGLDSCEVILGSKPVQDLLRSDEKFDLLIVELFNIDCFLGFVHRYKVPYIGLSSSNLLPTHNDRIGNPDNPSYIPNLFLPFSDKMTLPDRMLNTWSVLAIKFIKTYYFDVTSYKIASKYFGSDMPSLESIAKNVSLVLVNTHHTLNKPRPLVPAVIQVGGIHIKEPRRLPPVSIHADFLIVKK